MPPLRAKYIPARQAGKARICGSADLLWNRFARLLMKGELGGYDATLPRLKGLLSGV